MYQGKYAKHPAKRRGSKRASTVLLSLLLLTTLVVSGTLAYLTAKTSEVENVFTPSYVTTDVTEEFNGTVKKNVNATNTGDIPAWIRMKLVTYRVNDSGDRIGGTATIPDFTPGDGWVEKDGFYYYTSPVAPGDSPAAHLAASITLVGTYDDADGGKQVIEVMAEAIQAKGGKMEGGALIPAVTLAWGMIVGEDGVLSAPSTAG